MPKGRKKASIIPAATKDPFERHEAYMAIHPDPILDALAQRLFAWFNPAGKGADHKGRWFALTAAERWTYRQSITAITVAHLAAGRKPGHI